MKAIVVFLIVVSGCSSTYTRYETALRRFAVVDSDSLLSSGVRYGKGIVILASHTVTEVPVWIRTSEAMFNSPPPRKLGELALAGGDWLTLDTISVSDVFLGDEVFWFQPRFEIYGGVFLTFGRVAAITDSSFYIDRPIMYGASGSGVWNKRGQLVGVMQAFVSIHGFPMYCRASRVWVYRSVL